MAYCFAKGDASVEKGFRRIATELFDKAIKQAEKAQKGVPADEAIHQLRKQCKKLRGLYRLVRPGFADYAAENAAVRDAASGLSSARDAEVLVATLDALVKPVASLPHAVAAVRRTLEMRRDELARGANAAAALADFRDAMVAARKRARRWQLDEDEFDALAQGLETSFTRARKAMRTARKNPSADVFHEWRKRAKDHWHHSRLLAPVWPNLLDTHVKIAEDLGDLLGLHHDLSVFRDTISDMREADEDVTSFLDELAQRREAEVAAECFAIGARLLAEEPTALSRRWRVYWKCWRAEQRAPATEPVG